MIAHHRIEDRFMFPDLHGAQGDLEPVLERLGEEHLVIHANLVALDDAFVDLAEDAAAFDDVAIRVAAIADMLRSHSATRSNNSSGQKPRAW